jgi:hypothetical protein
VSVATRDRAQVDRAARAVHEVTGGGIPFGRSRHSSNTVSAQLVAEAALAAAGDSGAPAVALRIPDAAAACGVSEDHFNRHIRPHLRLISSGALTLVPVAELEKWAEIAAEMEVGASR